MVWYCHKHSQHSIDDACWKCDKEHDQPYIDAWLAGWDARHELENNIDENERENQLHEWKLKNSHLFRTRLRGTHDS